MPTIPVFAHCGNCGATREISRHGRCVSCGSDSVEHDGPDPIELARQIREQEAAKADRERFLRRGAPCSCPTLAPPAAGETKGES